MGDDKKKKAKPGFYRLGSAFIWAAALGGLGYYVGDDIWKCAGAAFGGLISGWATATILGFFGRGGARTSIMAVAGAVIGVCMASGAMAVTTSLPIILIKGLDAFKVDWDQFLAFVFNPRLMGPAAALGLVTGVYIHGKFAKGDKKK